MVREENPLDSMGLPTSGPRTPHSLPLSIQMGPPTSGPSTFLHSKLVRGRQQAFFSELAVVGEGTSFPGRRCTVRPAANVPSVTIARAPEKAALAVCIVNYYCCRV